MNISIFDVIGPIMIGPSSSHTAGAAKLSKSAVDIIGKKFYRVDFGLHGSFAKTGLGHGTDKALLAGALGFTENDKIIKNIYNEPVAQNIEYHFYEIDLGDVHENSCKITFYHPDNTTSEVIGSSIGGGRIKINTIDGAKVDIVLEQPNLIIKHKDRKGVISDITSHLNNYDINIGTIKLIRERKGGIVTTIIETDDNLYPQIIKNLQGLNNIIDVKLIKG